MIFQTKADKLLSVKEARIEFPVNRTAKIHAVSGINFHIEKGEVLGLVGESGCGKSTIAKSIAGLEKLTSGQIDFHSEAAKRPTRQRLPSIRPQVQMIFQDATASLNPGRRVGYSIAEPLRVAGKIDRKSQLQAAKVMLNDVGLDPKLFFNRFPFELSGGQCQRISIARALITSPKLLICDEPVSSLDVSIQAQILNLLRQLKDRYELSMLFISHDLAVIKNISDQIAVMYMGKLFEIANSEQLYQKPLHPYAKKLLAAVSNIRRPCNELTRLQASELPSPIDPPLGCRFHPQCQYAKSICTKLEPDMIQVDQNRSVACHFPLT